METLFFILFLSMAVLLIEVIISGTWQTFYFTKGIPLFKKTIRISGTPELSEQKLNDRFLGGLFIPLLFRQISPHSIAFREKLVSFRLIITYTPVMHGLIRYDEEMMELQIIGFANWFPCVFTVAFIAFFLSFANADLYFDLISILILAGIIAIIYLIQYKRFDGVYKALSMQNAWQKKEGKG